MIIFIKNGYNDSDFAKKEVLSKIMEIFSKSVSLSFSDSGKPILDDGYISFAHTENVFVAAYSAMNIGIDIENNNRQTKSPKIGTMKRWTEIEAFAKWTGDGVSKKLLEQQLDQAYLNYARICKEYCITIYSLDRDIVVCEIY